MGIKDLSFDDLIPQEQPRGIKALVFDDLVPARADDPGAFQAGLIGAGRMLDRLSKGVKQAGLNVAAIGSQSARDALTRMAEEEAQNTKEYQKLEQQHPVATMLGEAAPMVVLPMGGSVKAAAAVGALPGLLEYGTPEEKLKRGSLGAAGGGIGYGVGKAVGSVASPAMKAADPEAARLAAVAQREGIPLDAAQVTGNPVLQSAKSALSRIPWTATGQQARQAAQQEAFSAAALRHMGANAKAATPDVMADAFTAIVTKMDGAANSVALTIDQEAVNKLAAVEKTFLRRLPADQKPVIKSYLDDLTNLIGAPGGMPGDVYNKTRSELGRIAASTENITLREGAKGLQRVLDDAFDRQAPKEAVTAMKEARKEYSRYLTMEEALKKARSQDGHVPAKQLYAQAQQDIPGFVKGGGGDFNDLVRAGRQFLPDPIPNAGTADRLMYQNLLTAGSMSGLGALGGAFMPSDDGKTHAIPGAALGLLGFGTSKAAQRMLNSPQLTKYLMSDRLTEEQKRLLARAGGLLGLSAASAVAP